MRLQRITIAAMGLLILAGTRTTAAPPNEAHVVDQVNQLLAESWSKAGVEPARGATDAEFLRRISLDLTGVIPTLAEARRFVDEPDSGKRDSLIEELLGSPRHATHFARVWREVMLPSSLSDQFRLGGAVGFEGWLRAQFAANASYDAIVRQLLETTGPVNGQGPALYYAALEYKPEELAGSAARTFLGVQIQCAQCHNHPFDHWTQQDFWGMAAFFAQIRRPSQPQQFVPEVVDTNTGEVLLPDTNQIVPPRFLNGAPLDNSPVAGTRRAQLSRWLASAGNPYFARATVNRVWAHLFGRGLVDPVDDLGEHNPPSHPAVLDLLAADFAGSGFDLKRLLRILVRTDAYQLSSEVSADASAQRDQFAAMFVKSLSAEQIYDCVVRATCRRGADDDQASAGDLAERREFIARFDAPTQGATEFQGGIPQALTILNGGLVADSTHLEKSDLLAALADSSFLTTDDRLDVLYLATLSRRPTDDERARLAGYLGEDPSASSRRKLADVLWALLNSSEFILNH